MCSLPPPPLRLFVVALLLHFYYIHSWLPDHSFPSTSYDFISLSGYARLVHTTRPKVRTGHSNNSSPVLPCPLLPFESSFQTGNSFQPKNPYFWSLDDIELDEKAASDEMKIQVGGSWRPTECNPVHHVALIVPFRDRGIQLKKFLLYMHPFLQLQKISYKIFVIEQTDELPFNRGKLFNIGYNISAWDDPSLECFIFHDVDLLPESLSNVYSCAKRPRHMSAVTNTFRYTLLYPKLFGGATSITRETFDSVNGFSNNFFGWGGEDDDFFQRLANKGIEPIRLSPTLSSYRMLPHKKEAANLERLDVLKNGKMQHDKDGMNSLKFTLLNHISGPLYTLIQVKL